MWAPLSAADDSKGNVSLERKLVYKVPLATLICVYKDGNTFTRFLLLPLAATESQPLLSLR